VIANFATYVLAFAAGNFIYVAASDLIPELTRKIYKRQRRLRIATQAVAIAFGTLSLFLLI
jgi:zinc transporter ZupT